MLFMSVAKCLCRNLNDVLTAIALLMNLFISVQDVRRSFAEHARIIVVFLLTELVQNVIVLQPTGSGK